MMHKIKLDLSKLLQPIISGAKVMIAKADKPIARILPFAQMRGRRVPGSAKSKIWIAPDFNAPLPDEILAAFEGEAGM
jgi:antitoxin (DNA-binding transcriptional repressor) of toxin-antitoxin stability system